MHVCVHMVIFNACECAYVHSPDSEHISMSAEILSSSRGQIRADVWIKTVMAVGNWNRNPSISVSPGTRSNVSVRRRKGGERGRGAGAWLRGSVKLLTRTNSSRWKHETLGRCLNSEIDLFCWVQDNITAELRHIHNTPFTWETRGKTERKQRQQLQKPGTQTGSGWYIRFFFFAWLWRICWVTLTLEGRQNEITVSAFFYRPNLNCWMHHHGDYTVSTTTE